MYTFPQVKEPRGLTQGSLAKAVSSPHHPPSPRSTLDPVPETHACDLHLPGYLPNSWAVSLRAGAQPQGGQIGASHLWLEPPPLLSIYPVPRCLPRRALPLCGFVLYPQTPRFYPPVAPGRPCWESYIHCQLSPGFSLSQQQPCTQEHCTAPGAVTSKLHCF